MRALAAVMAAGSMLLGATGRAAEPPPDADLLEFLGSVDSDDSGWTDYLEKTDVGQVAKNHAPVAGPGAPPSRAPGPPPPGGPGPAAVSGSNPKPAANAPPPNEGKAR